MSKEEVQGAIDAVMVKSVSVDEETPIVKGFDFNAGVDYKKMVEAMYTTGFQATHLGRAVKIINNMLKWRLSDVPMTEAEIQENEELPEEDRVDRSQVKCTIFLGYTSNLISSGLREMIRFLCEHKLVDCIVTTAGGIEEDFIKCLAPHFLSDFNAKGSELRSKGLNRIGNLMIPNNNYCLFEDWLTPIMDTMLEEQLTKGTNWSPSKIINRLGKEINNEESVYYWCYKNDIPVYCPAITDGSLGDMFFFHSMNKPGFIIDILSDLRDINNFAIHAHKTGAVILGSGVIKHHICNANLMRNGTDYAVYVNTAQEFDGSDAGATPDEAVSWGKISAGAEQIKVHGDATIIFPLLCAQTFGEYYHAQKKEEVKTE